MKIEKKRLTELKPLEKNVRNHGDAQVKEMIRAIRTFGQTRPMVIDEEGNVLIGNCLYAALVQMNAKDADCFVVKGLTPSQKKKMVLSDNKIYRLGTDNFDVINDFLKEIAEEGDFEIPGFDADIVKRLVDDIREIDVQVQEYGKVDAQSFAPSAPNVPDVAVVQDSEPSEGADANQSRQFVVCPKCGEVIYLD